MQKSVMIIAIIAAFLCVPADADDLRSISVTGHGDVDAEPDIAMVRLSVIEFDADLVKSKQSVDGKFATLREAIKVFGVEAENVHATPHDIDSRYSETDGVISIVGYEVRRSVSVKLTDTKTVSAFLDKAILAGANRVRDTEFLSSRDTEIRDEAMQKAIADSKRRAATIAEGFGAKLGRVLKIESEGRESIGGALYSVEELSSDSDSPPKITVESKIHVVFELVD